MRSTVSTRFARFAAALDRRDELADGPRMNASALPYDDAVLGALTLRHLETVVAIDSQSDERSTTIPSTEGQRHLADLVSRFFIDLGASVEHDAFGNVVASLRGRGTGVDRPAVALMVHLDTARGTAATSRLERVSAWDGGPLHYPGNPTLRVDVATYPQLAEFVGHTVVHGSGVAPFGLDDKLGLAHMLTLARVLHDEPTIPHPPLLLIGRPDEEIGSMEAVRGLAAMLAARGVRSGYTIDGILPFEVNTSNFNGAAANLIFARGPEPMPSGELVALDLHGVNTHGATAHAEGHRAATRLAVEILDACPDAVALAFDSDALRDCDATVVVAIPTNRRDALIAAAHAVVGPHVPRGARVALRQAALDEIAKATPAAQRMLRWVRDFLASAPGMPLLAEDSYGWLGYSHPYRAHTRPDGSVSLDIRIRDFDADALAARKAHITRMADGQVQLLLRDQYVDMGPRLAHRPDLAEHAVAAAQDVGIVARRDPIRGGTGVDPFLDHGTAVANLGTGYFAPESEKELTSLELMAGHARWLVALVSRLAQ